MILSIPEDNPPLYKEKKGNYSEKFMNWHKALDFGRILISPNKNYDN